VLLHNGESIFLTSVLIFLFSVHEAGSKIQRLSGMRIQAADGPKTSQKYPKCKDFKTLFWKLANGFKNNYNTVLFFI
jgi:hypothetical protein